MAVGAIVANKPIKGSCGGLNSLGLKKGCAICGGVEDKQTLVNAEKPMFYDATTHKVNKEG